MNNRTRRHAATTYFATTSSRAKKKELFLGLSQPIPGLIFWRDVTKFSVSQANWNPPKSSSLAICLQHTRLTGVEIRDSRVMYEEEAEKLITKSRRILARSLD